MSPTSWGLVAGLCSAIAWSFANIVIPDTSRRFGDWPAAFGSQVLGILFLTGLAASRDGFGPLSSIEPLPLLTGAIAGAAAYGGLFKSLRLGPVAVAAPIISAWAVLACLITAWRRNQDISIYAGAGMAAVLLGNLLLSGNATPGETNSRSENRHQMLVWATISAFGFGVLVPAMDRVGEVTTPFWSPPLVWTAQWCLLFPFLWNILREAPRPSTRQDWIRLAAPGLLEAIGLLAVTIGLTSASASVVAPVSSLSTGFSVALALFLRGERLSKRGVIGAGFSCVGVILVNL